MHILREHIVESLIHCGTTSELWLGMRLGPGGFTVPVALKTLNAGCAAAPELLPAFIREARAGACVQHRHVIQTRDLILEGDRYWIAMELVRGWSLHALLSAIDSSRERLPIPVALSLARAAADGLQAIHDAGLVHRNVTLDNLMISTTGQLLVHDFGRAASQRIDDTGLTPTGRTSVDARNDVLSLGAILDLMIPHRKDVPIALDAIIRRAIDPDAARRFPSARALETALDLVSIRESWLITPSYLAAYVGDMLRGTPIAVPPPRSAAEPVEPVEPVPAAPRAVLPRGRRGMVGVGATLTVGRKHATGGDPIVRDTPPKRAPGYVRTQTPLTVTQLRVRR